MTTSSNIPSGVSSDDLEYFLSKAASEEANTRTGNGDGENGFYGSQMKNEEEITDKADELIREMSEFCDHPMAHKVIAMKILFNFVIWQTRMGEDSETSSVGWLRDAGKAQAAHEILKLSLIHI